MPLPADFEREIPTRMCETIVALLLADPVISAYTEGRIYHYEPQPRREPDQYFDDLKIAPLIYVWHEPDAEQFNPLPGDFASPRYAILILLLEQTILAPIPPGTVTSSDRLKRVEQVLELGSDPDNVRGSIADPDVTDPLAPTSKRFLNDMKPDFQRLRPKTIRATGTTAWGTVALYKSTIERNTRERP